MKKIFLLSLVLLTAAVCGCLSAPEERIKRVCFKEKCYDVELAQTEEQRSRGLMYRELLDADKGMLFIYKEDGTYSFWMKNTLIPLDIIWLESDGTVAHIVENAQPCPEEYCPSINPNRKARYVLEINGGEAKRLGVREGERMEFSDS